MSAQTVQPQDLEPDGWDCESCHKPFSVGDVAYGEPEGITTDGTGIEGNWVCLRCRVGVGAQLAELSGENEILRAIVAGIDAALPQYEGEDLDIAERGTRTATDLAAAEAAIERVRGIAQRWAVDHSGFDGVLAALDVRDAAGATDFDAIREVYRQWAYSSPTRHLFAPEAMAQIGRILNMRAGESP